MDWALYTQIRLNPVVKYRTCVSIAHSLTLCQSKSSVWTTQLSIIDPFSFKHFTTGHAPFYYGTRPPHVFPRSHILHKWRRYFFLPYILTTQRHWISLNPRIVPRGPNTDVVARWLSWSQHELTTQSTNASLHHFILKEHLVWTWQASLQTVSFLKLVCFQIVSFLKLVWLQFVQVSVPDFCFSVLWYVSVVTLLLD